MWFLLIYVQLTAVQAQDQIALRGSSHPCEGRLEVYHNNQWGLVCYHEWTSVNGEVVCKSLGCGDHVESGILNKNFPPLSNFWMDEIKCNGTENKLSGCKFNGWGIVQCQHQGYVSVKCSGSISLSLNLFGITNECAGVVQFITPNGIVSVCNQNWDTDKANKVCEELNCGTHQKSVATRTLNGTGSSHKVSLNCAGNEDFSWQCVDWVSAKANTCQEEISITCSNYKHERLHGGADVCEGTLQKKSSTEGGWANVSCQEGDYNMFDYTCAKLKCGRAHSVKPCNESKNTWLKCSDRVEIELLNSGKKPSPCHGELHVRVNGADHAVCLNEITNKEISKEVCQELRCGTLLFQGPVEIRNETTRFRCLGQEKSLWECMHNTGTFASCQPIKVLCSGSLKMGLTNGPDKCAGQLEIKLFGEWSSVSSNAWPKVNSDMVCQHLGCGESKNIDQYRFVKSKLSPQKLKMTCTGSSISQCTIEQLSQQKDQQKIINIICNEHQLWFLQGDSPCEGKVKAENGQYLKTITYERAKEVCIQNLCGGLDSNKSNMNSSVCHENATSPNCSMTNTSTSTEPQFAYVKCSGKETPAAKPMKVWLENGCYGKVLVCLHENCGVCEDTWTPKHSKMLCKSLGCGKEIGGTYSGNKMNGVSVASVHCSQSAKEFSQCNFVKLNDTSLCQKAAYVACTGSVKAELQDPRDKCAGHLKLFYSGAWQSVCTNNDRKILNFICTNLGCGAFLSFDKFIGSMSTSRGMSSFTCKDSNISNCDFSSTTVQQCDVGHLKCKGWRRLLLTSAKAACAGEVYLQNEEDLYIVSNDGWGKQESNELCKYLECGNFSETTTEKQMNMTFWRRSYSCTGKTNSIWDCEKEKTPANHHLHISCTDKPQVTLKHNCTGELWLKNERMCYNSNQMNSFFHELCQDLGCSMFFKSWSTTHNGNARHLSCTGKESKLWQCNSWTDKCEKVVSLACTKAIKWNFSHPCGGELQVNYRRQWEPVCALEDVSDAHKICKDLKCGSASDIRDEFIKHGTTDVGIKCENNPNYLMHCFKLRTESCTRKALIYCDDYKPTVKTYKPNTELTLGVVLGLVMLLVAAPIMFWKRKSFLAILRFKSSAEDSDMEISENEMQRLNKKDVFETDDYDSVVSTRNPAEDNQSQGSASDHDEEDMSTSEGSSGTEYDDVDEENVKPRRPDNFLDKVTFEAEVEPQEDYDDVIVPQTVASEQRESLDIPDPSLDPPLLVSKHEAELQEDE